MSEILDSRYDSRRVELYITYTNNSGEEVTVTNDQIYAESMSLDQILSDGGIKIGSCNSAKFEIQLDGVEDLTDKKIKVVQKIIPLNLDGSDMHVNFHKTWNIGTFFVDSCTKTMQTNERKIVAYDRMYNISNRDVFSWYDALFERSYKDEYKGEISTYLTTTGNRKKGEVIYFDGTDNKELAGYYKFFSDFYLSSGGLGNAIRMKAAVLLVDYNPYQYATKTLGQIQDSLCKYLSIEQEGKITTNDYIVIRKDMNLTSLLAGEMLSIIATLKGCFAYFNGEDKLVWSNVKSNEQYVGKYQQPLTYYRDGTLHSYPNIYLGGDIVLMDDGKYYKCTRGGYADKNNFTLVNNPEFSLNNIYIPQGSAYEEYDTLSLDVLEVWQGEKLVTRRKIGEIASKFAKNYQESYCGTYNSRSIGYNAFDIVEYEGKYYQFTDTVTNVLDIMPFSVLKNYNYVIEMPSDYQPPSIKGIYTINLDSVALASYGRNADHEYRLNMLAAFDNIARELTMCKTYTPCKINAIGQPFMELGQVYSLNISDSGKSIRSIVLSRNIKGIQAQTDTYSADAQASATNTKSKNISNNNGSSANTEDSSINPLCYAQLTGSGSQTLSTTSQAILLLTTLKTNSSSIFTFENSRIKINASGTYKVSATFRVDTVPDASAVQTIRVVKNSTGMAYASYRYDVTPTGQVNPYTNIAVSDYIFDAVEGDTISLYGQTGKAGTIVNKINTLCRLYVEKVG